MGHMTTSDGLPAFLAGRRLVRNPEDGSLVPIAQLGRVFSLQGTSSPTVQANRFIQHGPLWRPPFEGKYLKSKRSFDCRLRRPCHIHSSTHTCLRYSALAARDSSWNDESNIARRRRAAFAIAHGEPPEPPLRKRSRKDSGTEEDTSEEEESELEEAELEESTEKDYGGEDAKPAAKEDDVDDADAVDGETPPIGKCW